MRYLLASFLQTPRQGWAVRTSFSSALQEDPSPPCPAPSDPAPSSPCGRGRLRARPRTDQPTKERSRQTPSTGRGTWGWDRRLRPRGSSRLLRAMRSRKRPECQSCASLAPPVKRKRGRTWSPSHDPETVLDTLLQPTDHSDHGRRVLSTVGETQTPHDDDRPAILPEIRRRLQDLLLVHLKRKKKKSVWKVSLRDCNGREREKCTYQMRPVL